MPVPDPIRRPEHPNNPYSSRWRWWYSSISDLMLDHPDWTQKEIAAALGKSTNTIYYIMSTNLFADYHAQRKAELHALRADALQAKLHGVAAKGLDLLLDVMNKKQDCVPLKQLTEITSSALENLGYGPKAAPTVAVQVNNSNQPVAVPVTAAELAEARDVLRLAQERRREVDSLPPPPTGRSEVDKLLDNEEEPSVPRIVEQ